MANQEHVRWEYEMGLCCEHCFEEEYIIEWIRVHGSPLTEPCDYCGSSDGSGIEAGDLGDLVHPVVEDAYCQGDQLSQAAHVDFTDGDDLGLLLDEDFGVFSANVEDQQENLLGDILGTWEDSHLNMRSVDPNTWFRKESDWAHWGFEDYVYTLKTEVLERGHGVSIPPHPDDKPLLEASYEVIAEAINLAEIQFPEHTKWFRARIGQGLSGDDIGAPPARLASAGRGNLQGQPVLYLANSVEAAIAEVRPSIEDIVSVGEFCLTRDTRICELLPGREYVSPFRSLKEYREACKRNEVRSGLGEQFGKPIRRADEPSEYLFTQYVARAIWSNGFDGIAFPSSQHRPDGTNYLLFRPAIANQIGQSKEYRIQNIFYKHQAAT